MAIATAEVVMQQELHLRGLPARQYEKDMAAAGWRCHITDAVDSQAPGGAAVPRRGVMRPRGARLTDNTGGVAIAVRKHTRLACVHGRPSLTVAPGRASLAHWSACLPGGLTLGTVYLVTGAGAGQANVDIMMAVSDVLREVMRPFVIGGTST